MVLLAAAIFSKDGKPLLSRQFVEMSRIRIEGLLTSFPKLIGTDEKLSDKTKKVDQWKQHTFVETESVRYVYQPLEKLYVLLLTTKASNILEDLDTLRLFAKVIPEYSRSLDEYDVKENIFDIISAFDEIVALGYKENVNLTQIRTFTEMDSHEEKVFLAVRENQVRETKEKMRKKALEIQSRREKPGSQYSVMKSGGFGNAGQSNICTTGADNAGLESYIKAKMVMTSTSNTKTSGGKAMRLGGKAHVVDNFVDQLKAEGVAGLDQSVLAAGGGLSRDKALNAVSSSPGMMEQRENVHLRIEERLKVTDNHNSGLGLMELQGMMTLFVGASENNFLRLAISTDSGIDLQSTPHPFIDKKIFQAQSVLQPKTQNKPFPVNQDVGLLKWHFQTQDENLLPFRINCWPSKVGTGCSVNIEYELKNCDLQLENVVISIPLPSGSGAPIMGDYTGDFSLDPAKTHMRWTLDLIDAESSSGNMEFDTKIGNTEDFFPIIISFTSFSTLSGIKVSHIEDQSGNEVKFSSETSMFAEDFKIL